MFHDPHQISSPEKDRNVSYRDRHGRCKETYQKGREKLILTDRPIIKNKYKEDIGLCMRYSRYICMYVHMYVLL